MKKAVLTLLFFFALSVSFIPAKAQYTDLNSTGVESYERTLWNIIWHSHVVWYKYNGRTYFQIEMDTKD